MISYDKYQNRIKRVAAIKNFIVRFRWPIIALFALLIAGSLALMFMQGMVTQKTVLPENVVYGDYYADEIKHPKAFLSDAKYQFKRIDEENNAKSAAKYSKVESEVKAESEWTYELPTLAGKYLVRTVTKKIFGTSYSNAGQFEIATKSIDFIIKSNSVVYSEMPANYEFNTIKGDNLDEKSVRFIYDNPEADSTKISADKNSFKIYNSKGEDVTFCYNISAPETEEEVEILPKSETLAPREETLKDSSWVWTCEYIGEQVAYVNSVYHLKGGDVTFTTKISGIAGEIEGNPVTVGTYTVEVVSAQVFSGENNVTGHYNFSYLKSYITINKRIITVTTPSLSKEYDGEPFDREKAEKVTIDTLISDHDYDAVFTPTDVVKKTYTNSCSLTIFDENGQDVTVNYDIKNDFGTLEITARKITLKTKDYNKIYDGNTEFDISEDSYWLERDDSADALVLGHRSQIIAHICESANVGLYDNYISIVIVDEDGYTQTSNYDIEDDFGTLEILHREIKITSKTQKFDYNGEPQGTDGYEDVVLISVIEGVSAALPDDEEIYVKDNTKVTYVTKEAVENVIVCGVQKFNGSDTTQNYKIDYDNGYLTMQSSEITVYNAEKREQYSGKKLFGDDKTIFDGLLFGGDYPVPDFVSEILYVGETLNETTYIICNADGEDVTDSYKINYVNENKLIIEQKELIIYTPTVQKIYDGTPLYGDMEEYGEAPRFDGLAEGERYEPYDPTENTEYGEIDNETKYRFYAIHDGVEVQTTAYYKVVEVVYGKVKINKRPVWIVTPTDSREYNGGAFQVLDGVEADYPEGGEYGLLSNHDLKVDKEADNAYIIDVGSTQNVVYFQVFEGEREVTHNYDLEANSDFGTLTVTPRLICIATDDGKWVYADIDYSATEPVNIVHLNSDRLPDEEPAFAPGHTHQLVHGVTIREAKTVDNTCTYDVVDGDNNVVTYNYDIIVNPGLLVVTKRPIIVTTATQKIEYDGKDHYYTVYEKQEGGEVDGEKLAIGLVEDHELVAKTDNNGIPLATTVNKVMWKGDEFEGTDNEVEYKILKGDIDVSANYEIEVICGTLTVTPREITITTPKESHKEFDGEEFFYCSTDPDEVLKNSTLADGHCLVVEEYTSVTFVTDGKITNEVIYSIQKDGEPLTENYKIFYDYGEIWITKRYVQVNTFVGEWIYDGDPHSETGYKDYHLTDVVLDSDGKVIDRKIEIGVEGLVLGHKLKVIAFTEATDCVSQDNVVIYEVENKDIDQNYYLHMVYSSFDIVKRHIYLTTGSAEKVYDGDPFSYTEGWSVEGEVVDGVKLDALVKDHTLEVVEIITEITDVVWVDGIVGGEVGGVPNEVIYKVIDGEGNDAVNSNYIITLYMRGTLKRLPREIEIGTGSDKKEYDGTALTCEKYSVEPCSEDNTRGLVQDKFKHKAILDESQKIGSITYIFKDGNGELIFTEQNERHYRIFAGEEEKTGNYNIIPIYGTLTLTQRELTITTPSLDQEYNGRWLYGDNESFEPLATVDKLVENEIFYAITRARIIDFVEGGIENDTKYRTSVLVGGQYIDTTNCYDIKYKNGTLSIIKANLTITRLSPTKIYDGEELFGDEQEYDENFDEELYFDGKVKGETYLSFNANSIIDYGTTPNLTEYYIFAEREDGVKETTENYNISYKEGTLTVEKRVIWVVSGSDEKEYDGDEFFCLDDWHITSELGLVKDHTLEAELWTKVTDVKRDKNDDPVAYANEVTFKVIDKNDSEHDVNKNYIIEYLNADGEEQYGELLITPRLVRIITDDGKWVYDGKLKSAPGETYSHGSGTSADNFIPDDKDAFVLDHELSRLSAREEKNVDKYENICTYDVIDKANGDETVLKNYTLYIVHGTLIITERPIIVTTDKGEQEYDGTPLKKEGFKAQEYGIDEGLAEGHTAETKEGQQYISITDVLESGAKNAILIVILDEESEDVTKNYEIDYQYGILTITRRVVYIKTASLSDEYDGTKKSAPGETYKHGSGTSIEDFVADEKVAFVLEHDLLRLTAREEIDADTYQNICTYDVIDLADAKKSSVISNYLLLVDYGELIIGKRKLTIVAATLEKVYDGSPLMGDDTSEKYGDAVYFEGLAEGEFLGAYGISQLTDFGTLTNNTQYDVYAYRDGEDGEPTKTTKNYVIDYTAGSLTVNKRTIWIITGNVTEEYDGNEHTGEESYSFSKDYYDLVKGHALQAVEIIGRLTDVKWEGDEILSVENKVLYKVVDEKGDDAVNGNYDIVDYTYGTLTVLPRNISVRTASESKEYDGTVLTNTEDYEITFGSVLTALGHDLGVSKDCKIPFVKDVDEGEVINELIYVVYDKDGNVSRNYIVTPDGYGKLSRFARTVSIVLQSIDDMYYGDPFSGYPACDADYEYATGSKHIVDGEKLVISVKYQYNDKDIDVENDRLNVGTYYVVFADKRIVDGKLTNYDISIVDGNSFEIYKRAITIELIEPEIVSKIYDGKEFKFDCSVDGGYQIVEGATYYDDVITIAVTYLKDGYDTRKVLDAGKYTIIFDESGCNVDGDLNLAANYAISCRTESLSYEITPRPITFTFSDDMTYEYTGLPCDPSSTQTILFDDSQLADIDRYGYARGSAMKGGEAVEAVYVGEYEYVVSSFHIFRKEGGDNSSKNYYIDEEKQQSGLLEITPRQIKVSVYFGEVAGHDYTGELIDLIDEYPDYGPYMSTPVNDTVNSWGIYTDDLDEIYAEFTITQNGEVVDLIARGTYHVSIELKDRGDGTLFEHNYKPVYEDSDFEITYRRITVTPKMTGENLIYDGQKLNSDFLDFDSKHVYSDEVGFLDDDSADYDIIYHLYEVGGNGKDLLDEILQAGTYYLKITFVYNNPEKEEHYFIEEVFESEEFTVGQRNLFISTPDDTTDYVYNKTAAKMPNDKDCVMYYQDGIWRPGGFVNNDDDGVTFQYMFYIGNTGYPKAVNAGTYTIRVVDFIGGNSEFLHRNYFIQNNVAANDTLKHGTLTIRSAKLVVVPHSDYYVNYDGKNNKVTMPSSNFEIKYVEGRDDCTLFEDATVAVTFSNELDVTKAAAARVSINGIEIYEDGRNIASNYQLISSYSLLREHLPEMVEEITQADFYAVIGYNQIKITVNQPAPPAGYEKVEYGTNSSITFSGAWIITDYVENAATVLREGHRVEVAMARVTATSMDNVKQWLIRCKVLTDDGTDVSFGYDITIVCGNGSGIEVEARKISVKINISLEGLENGHVLEAGEYSLVSGTLVYAALLKVIVMDGKCVVTVVSRADDDLTYCYDIDVTYSDEEINEKEAEYASWI